MSGIRKYTYNVSENREVGRCKRCLRIASSPTSIDQIQFGLRAWRRGVMAINIA